MQKEDYIDRPPGPLGGLWSMWYLDPFLMIKRELSGFRKVRHKAFEDQLKPGCPAPPVKLQSTSGETVDLADFRGKKNIVLEFGAIT